MGVQLSVLREADMFHTWGPFINKSLIVKEAGKCSMVMYFNIFVPLIANRYAVLHDSFAAFSNLNH
jgi:hypothetical protein